MYAVIRLTGFYGQLRGLDPGRPGVPPYGSRLYRLNAWSSRGAVASIPEIAVARKAQASIPVLRRNGDLDAWLSHFSSFMDTLERATYNGLALDYDGTLCDRRDRFTGLTSSIREALVSVLEKGISVTVITGRGRSVGDALREAIPKRYWNNVRVAYYNGSELHPLAFGGVLEDSLVKSPILDMLRAKIESHASLRSLTIEIRRNQLSIATSSYMAPESIHRIVADIVSVGAIEGARVTTSSHSVDVLLPPASKVLPLGEPDSNFSFLCIGDSGEWPGNDFDLLSRVGSLSCHRTSRLPDRCWHISPAGWRDSQATLHYFSAIRHSHFGFRIDSGRLLSSQS